MQCMRRRKDDPINLESCFHCGMPLQLSCAHCGSILVAGANFCHICGQPSATAPSLSRTPPHQVDNTSESIDTNIVAVRHLDDERKRLTVLFADIRASTEAIADLDPEDAKNFLDPVIDLMKSAVRRFGGTVNRVTGDGIMALFGAPASQEDHALRACHAALAMQQEVQRIAVGSAPRAVRCQIRVGLNSGETLLRTIKHDFSTEYSAEGLTTHLAARLEQLAPPGKILLSEESLRLVDAVAQTREHGPVAVKGLANPARVFELLSLRASQRFSAGTRRALTRFVGRSAEGGVLDACWQRAKGGVGQIVSVVGEAGVGKSRLLMEFRKRLDGEAARCIEGSCFAYGDGISYLPFLEIVRTLLGIETTADAFRARACAEARVSEFGVGEEAVPYLLRLLAYESDRELFDRLDPYVIRERTISALGSLIAGYARERPAVIVIEDLHWIDKATEEALAALVETIHQLPLLLVLVYRPEYLHGWESRPNHARITVDRLSGGQTAAMVEAIVLMPNASKLKLEPLSNEQSAALAREVLQADALAPELSAFVAAKSGGNPLFVEELTRSLLEGDELSRTASGYQLRRPTVAASVPTTIQGVLLSRIDRVRGDLKHVLQVASVIGRVFSRPMLEKALAPMYAATLDSLIEQLVDAQFVYPTAAGREYSFKHVLTQESIYQTLSRVRREECHERIGQAIEQLYEMRLEEQYELLAYHFTRSRNADKAVEYLDLANRKAARANASEVAWSHFEQAMDLLDNLPDNTTNQRRRLDILVRQPLLALLVFRLREYRDYMQRFATLGASFPDPGLRGAFYSSLAWSQFCFGEFQAAIDNGKEGARLCEEAGRFDFAALGYLPQQWSFLHKGDCELVKPTQLHILDCLDKQPHPRAQMWGRTASSWAYAFLGQWDLAIKEGEEGIRVGEQFGDRGAVSFGALSVAAAAAYRFDVATAVKYAQLALENAPTLADKTWSQGVLGFAHCRNNEAEQGLPLLEQLVTVSREVGFVPNEVFSAYLAEAYIAVGQLVKAREFLIDLVARTERHGMRLYAATARRLLGDLELILDLTEAGGVRAQAHYETSIAEFRALRAENELALARLGLARARRACGDYDGGRSEFEAALGLFERLGTLRQPELIRAELAALPV